MRILHRITPIILCLLCVSCATRYNRATGRREVQIISSLEEIRIGEQINQKILEGKTLSPRPEYLARVQRVGQRLVSSIESRGIPYTFGVIEDSNLNAYTIPGGYVYATTGLMESVRNDDELAAVLAHEIGHAEARHAVKKLESAYGFNTIVTLAYVLDQRKAEEKKDWKYIGASAQTVYQLISLGYSRNDEYAADALGIRYMTRAGYDPEAMLTLFSTMEARQQQNDVRWLYFLRSHPFLNDRKKAAVDLIADKSKPVLEMSQPSPS